MDYVRQHYLNLFKAESKRENRSSTNSSEKKVPHNFFLFFPKFAQIYERARKLWDKLFYFWPKLARMG